MKFKATLSRKTTDDIRSSLLSPNRAVLILDIFKEDGTMPQAFAEIINTYFESEFIVELKNT
jgi:hypothetical protein